MKNTDEFRILDEYSSLLSDEAIRRAKQGNDILQKVKKLLTKYKFKKLEEFIYECGDVYNFEIVNKDKVFGDKQEEGYWFNYIYIQQTIGHICDDYYGTIFIPLPKDIFLKFEYNC